MQGIDGLCEFLFEIARCDNGANVVTQLSGKEVLIVQDPDDADRILRLNAANYQKNMAWFRNVLGASRFTENGEIWEMRRQLTQPFFNRFDREIAFNEATRCSLDALDSLKAATSRGELRLDDGIFRRLTADILLRCFFQQTLEESGVNMDVMSQAMEFASQYAFVPAGETSRQFRQSVPELISNRRALMETLRKFRSPDMAQHPIISAIRCAEQDEGSGVILEHEMISFLSAGSETSAATIGWLCYLLAREPELQDLLREDAMEFFRGGRDAAGPSTSATCPWSAGGIETVASNSHAPSWKRLTEFPRLVRFVGETLRLFPATPLVSRISVDVDNLGGRHIASGENVLVSLIGVNHATALRVDPWSIDLSVGHPKMGFGDTASFSVGPRVCGGKNFAMLELVTVLASFLVHVRFELSDRGPLQFHWRGQLLRSGGQPVTVHAL